MKELFLGIDVGSISTKGVVIDGDYKIIASDYIWTQADPISAIKRLILSLRLQISEESVVKSVGTTGSARKLAGAILNANVIKNEITAHAVGTLSRFKDVRTVLEIGGQDSKIILIRQGIVHDYAMNTLCAAGTGAFLAAQASRLGIRVEDIGAIAGTAKNPTKLAARCSVFAESDMVHKAQTGHKKEDLIAGLCNAVVANYLNNVAKGKKIEAPIVFQGGVSKNSAVVRAFEAALNSPILVDENSHLFGAIGAAILSSREKSLSPFDFNVAEIDFKSGGYECNACPNNCEVTTISRGEKLIDSWGKRCTQ